jgi:hypothetical protein
MAALTPTLSRRERGRHALDARLQGAVAQPVSPLSRRERGRYALDARLQGAVAQPVSPLSPSEGERAGVRGQALSC